MSFSLDDSFKSTRDKYGNFYMMKKVSTLPSGWGYWDVMVMCPGLSNTRKIGGFIDSKPSGIYMLYSHHVTKDMTDARKWHGRIKMDFLFSAPIIDDLLPKDTIVVRYSKDLAVACNRAAVAKFGTLTEAKESIDEKEKKPWKRDVYIVPIDKFTLLDYQTQLFEAKESAKNEDPID